VRRSPSQAHDSAVSQPLLKPTASFLRLSPLRSASTRLALLRSPKSSNRSANLFSATSLGSQPALPRMSVSKTHGVGAQGCDQLQPERSVRPSSKKSRRQQGRQQFNHPLTVPRPVVYRGGTWSIHAQHPLNYASFPADNVPDAWYLILQKRLTSFVTFSAPPDLAEAAPTRPGGPPPVSPKTARQA